MSERSKDVLTHAITLVLLIVIYALGFFYGAAVATNRANAWRLPCKEEDSINCTWDASTEGNGEGYSFIDHDGVAYYKDSPTLERLFNK